VLGGGDTGVEMADLLSRQGKKVTILEMREEIGIDMHPAIRSFLLQRLADQGVSIITSTKAVCVQNACLLTDGPTGSQELDCFDQIVSSVGAEPNDALTKQLKNAGCKLFVIGDAQDPRDAMAAIFEGQEAAMTI